MSPCFSLSQWMCFHLFPLRALVAADPSISHSYSVCGVSLKKKIKNQQLLLSTLKEEQKWQQSKKMKIQCCKLGSTAAISCATAVVCLERDINKLIWKVTWFWKDFCLAQNTTLQHQIPFTFQISNLPCFVAVVVLYLIISISEFLQLSATCRQHGTFYRMLQQTRSLPQTNI